MNARKLLKYYRKFRGYPRFSSPKYARMSALMWAAPTSRALTTHTFKYKRYWIHR